MKGPSLARTAARKHVILFLAANPRDTGRLALDAEARSIHLELKRSGFGDRFDFVTRWAMEPLDLLRELRELQPTIVHFSGHATRPATTGPPTASPELAAMGAPSNGPLGLLVHNGQGDSLIVSHDALAQTFDVVGAQVRLVVLNACYSASIAEALLAHVDCVVGMSGAIHDDAARSFAIGFYGSLGEQKSIAAAFKQGQAAISLDGLLGAAKPQLHVRDGFDPAQLILAAVTPSVLLDVPCPYPGMRPFTVDDAARFHGRDGEIDDLIDRLRAGEREIYVFRNWR